MPIEVNEKGELIAPNMTYGKLRSEAMSELVSRQSGFLGRWALLIFLVLLLLLAGTTWFIRYPDIVITRATLLATNAPKEIIARQEGRLTKLFVQNNDVVNEGTVLGFMESNARHEQVLLLNAYLDTTISDLQKNNTQNIISRFSVNLDALGELQQGYQQFIVAYQQFSDYLQDGFYLKKKQTLNEDLLYIQKNNDILQQQKDLMLKDLYLSEETYKANVSLLKDKVISRQDDRNEQSKLLNKQLNVPQISAAILTNETQQRDKQKEISELEHTISLQKTIFLQSAQTLQSLVAEWIRKYVLIAPVGGKIVFLIPVQKNLFVKMGRSLGFINPPDTKYYAEINLPQYNFGKVNTGQSVQLHFDAYPYQEFGYVKARLNFITDIATDSGFLANVQLANGLVTSQHKILRYHDGLKAEAQIITNDMRLLERFYYGILKTVNRR